MATDPQSDSAEPLLPTGGDVVETGNGTKSEKPATSRMSEEGQDLIDELPEWEELTPELFEEECQRGDFMLRWASILIGVLLGCTYLTDTRLLVSIRSGEYSLAHGVLPPRTDVFSAATENRPWVNLGWLSDIVLAGVHSLGGMGSLSILGAVTLAVSAWLLSRIQVRNVSSWWSSLCAACALVAIFPIIQPGAATITVLGLVALLALCHRWTVKPSCGLLWLLPVLFLLWGNLDPRAWAGLLLLALFAAGQFFATRGQAEAATGRNTLIVGLALGAGILANPWPGRPLTAWLTQWRALAEERDYATAGDLFSQLHYGLAAPEFWKNWDVFSIFAVILLTVSFTTLCLNFRKLHLGWVAVWMAINVLSLFYGSFVCYASIVNAVIAGLNAQEWSLRALRQDYTVTTGAVFYSRAGRALTVLGFFAISYLALNGQLMGPASRRIGIGLDPRWKNRIENLEMAVVSKAGGDKIFPTVPDLGDLLIWLGKKPFIDSRMTMYCEAPNLAKLHREIRGSLFLRNAPKEQPEAEETKPESTTPADKPAEASAATDTEKPAASEGKAEVAKKEDTQPAEADAAKAKPAVAAAKGDTADEPDPDLWKSELSRFGIRDVMTRLWGNPPPYTPLLQMMIRPEFSMVAFGAAGADFERLDDLPEVERKAVEEKRVTRFSETAFRPEKPPAVVDLARIWPAALSKYDRWLIQRLPVSSSAAELAAHQIYLCEAFGQRMSAQQVAALATLAIRNSRQALHENPNHPLPYRVLSQAYSILGSLEQQAVIAGGGQTSRSIRSTQALTAAFNAARASGNEQRDLLRLFQILLAEQKLDMARNIYEQIDFSDAIFTGADAAERQEEIRKIGKQLTEITNDVRTKVDAARATKTKIEDLVSLAVSGNCPALAVSLLEQDLTVLSQIPTLQILYATLLLDVGRISDAYDQVESLEQRMPKGHIPPEMLPVVTQWRYMTAVINLCSMNVDRAQELWGLDKTTQLRTALQSLLQQPFASIVTPQQTDLWAAITGRVTFSSLFETPDRCGQLQLQQAQADLEAGRLKPATELLEGILTPHPDFNQRGVALFYLGMLNGKPFELKFPQANETEPLPDLTEPQTPTATEEKTEEKTEEAAPAAPAMKSEAPKSEAPKSEAPKSEAPKSEAPKSEAPKSEAPKSEAPKSEAPKSEPGQTEPAATESAKTD
ncbi:hypothetical protein [Planctomicrobium sp. SH664]|uniref:hypothetical protein n=1 Tax=Planctomicrobium sp. SH664 TaxID=3448125 RepID=UPI003F5CA14D